VIPEGLMALHHAELKAHRWLKSVDTMHIAAYINQHVMT
jgi:hypothetical protein